MTTMVIEVPACESCARAPATVPIGFPDGARFNVCALCAPVVVVPEPRGARKVQHGEGRGVTGCRCAACITSRRRYWRERARIERKAGKR